MDLSSISLLQAVVVFVAGIGAGFVNSMAGGGSLMAIAALLFIGMPSTIANATNRVAIVMQNSVSVGRFRRAGLLDLRDTMTAVVPASLGAIVGTLIAVEIPEQIFDIALAVVIVLVLITVFLPSPGSRSNSRPNADSDTDFDATLPALSRSRPVLFAIAQGTAFFVVGIYGGFVQSGVGFLLLAVIRWIRGYDLVASNAVKVSIVVVFGAISLAIFAVNGMVVWSAGILLGLGTMVGAWLGVHLAIRHGSGFVRWVVVLSALAAALRLLGAF